MLQVSVNCPYCRRSLEDDKVLVDNFPSVKTKAICRGQEGFLHLSSTYGSFQTETDLPIEMGDVVEFFCPYCGGSLKTKAICKECDAPMMRVDLDAGGYIRFCSRKGCCNHHIAFEDIYKELREFLTQYPAILSPFPREDENQGGNG
jgi:hypothetical protein